ncbi:hypothetical protein O181_060252 [Austropuccinia psidii MF-1]|uniref:Uncharacterized protein n=1 Tax=Austropuccinia psidii MF-1 TaxID=1389203 RepID=A0A9Q3EIA7_9BASI|nr:hypothetical protein [Austropuccinia psidii MF-1]
MIDLNSSVWEETEIWSTPIHSPLNSASINQKFHHPTSSSSSEIDHHQNLQDNQDNQDHQDSDHLGQDQDQEQNDQVSFSNHSNLIINPSSFDSLHSNHLNLDIDLNQVIPSNQSEMNLHSINQNQDDDDEFGDFDDGDGDAEIIHDNFQNIQSNHFISNASSTPLIPLKLPPTFNPEKLAEIISPCLHSLFSLESSHSNLSNWSSTSSQKSQLDQQPSNSQITSIPSIIKSSSILQIWSTLSDPNNSLRNQVDWKRSQIRRLYLVHLGIPVDLNDFLAPTPLSRLLTIDTKTLASSPSTRNSLDHKILSRSPVGHSPLKSPSFDRQRCQELIQLNQVQLTTQNLPQLNSICDELSILTQQASEFLSFKLQQRDQSIQDCQSYNTMISDLVLAAQRIKMAAAGSTKRSSIHLGSSSIASPSSFTQPALSKWRTFSSTGGHNHRNSYSGPTSPSV